MLIQNIVTVIRNLRAQYHIEPAKKIDVIISAGKQKILLRTQNEVLKSLCRIEKLMIEESIVQPKGSLSAVVSSVEIFIPLSGIMDMEKERSRIQKEMAHLTERIERLEKHLSDNNYISKAPAEIIAKERDRLRETKEQLNTQKKYFQEINPS